MKTSTLAVQSGPRRHAHDAVTPAVSLTSTYAFESTKELCAYFDGDLEREEYGRYGNPTVRGVEQKIAALDGAAEAALFGSGMAAVTTSLLAVLKASDHAVLTSDCYRRTRQFVGTFLGKLGVESTLVEPGDFTGLSAAIRPGKTKVIVSESPTNPYLRVADLVKLAAVKARHPGLLLFIDSTFATPVNQRPLELGADLCIHSATKYLGGHNDLLAGSVSGRAGLVQAIRDLRGVLGGVLDPHSAYLLGRGLKTLPLRVRAHNENALAVATWLEAQPGVQRVWYPGLPSHPDHAVARAQMTGFGGVVTFEVKGGLAAGSRLVDACRLARIAPSLGGVETLIEQPALMSFYELTTEQRLAVGIKDELVRLSVGIEDAADIIADLARALDAAQTGAAS